MQVMCAVLQVLNQIIKDNTDYLENACLVGFVSFVFTLRFQSPRFDECHKNAI